LGVALLALAPAASADSVLQVCHGADRHTVAQKDRALRFTALIRQALDLSGARLALISRAGVDLSRFGMRYSHAGFSLREPPDRDASPWSVRQLYVDCDAGHPQIFDQGLAAFVLGAERPDEGHVSIVLLPEADAVRVERTAADDRLALHLLHPVYSANSHPWSTRFQNCNQWVLEMLAAAWDDGPSEAAGSGPGALRQRAQHWLRRSDYQPAVFDVAPWLMAAGLFIPWIRNADHPASDLEANRYQVTTPASIEAFVRARLPTARRLQFCYTAQHAVVRDGWEPMADGCVPSGTDRVVPMNP
jgi:hypothetical protein